MSLTIPIVLYHGSEEWQKETIESYFGDIPSVLVPYLPRFEYELIDFRKITEAEIEAIRFLFLKNIFRAFKYGRDEGYLSLNWYKILIFAPEARQSHIYPGLLQATVIYCSRVSNIFNEKIVDMDRMLSIEDQNIIRPYVLKLYEEGIEKGIEKGIERMLLPFLKRYSDWSDKQLAELFELQEEQIARLRKKLKDGEG